MSERSRSAVRIAMLVVWAILFGAPAISQDAKTGAKRGADSQGAPFTLRLTFGHRDEQPTQWDGQLRMEGGQVERLDGWHFLAKDRIVTNTSWQARTEQEAGGRAGRRPATPSVLATGITVYGSAQPGAKISVETPAGPFDVNLEDLRLGESLEQLDGAVRVVLMPSTTLLSDGFTEDDFPSIAAGPDGSIWAGWSAYTGVGDEIRVCRLQGNAWSPFTRVPGVSGDVWMPQVGVDAAGKLWAVWAQQVKGNFDIYARALDGNTWLETVCLSNRPNPDINPNLCVDKDRNLWVAWQGFGEKNSDIFLRKYDGNKWCEEICITSSPANDWFPQVAVDSKGRAHVVWDSYRNGNYDVFLRTWADGKLSEEMAVAATPQYEAFASVACDKLDRVWVAYEIGPVNWAKDQGFTIRMDRVGSPINGKREIGVRCLVDGQFKEPVGNVNETVAPWAMRDYCLKPGILCDNDGRIWVRLRARFARKTGKPPRIKMQGWWEEFLTCNTGDGWSSPIIFPESQGRISMFTRMSVAPDGKIWTIWPTDSRLFIQPHQINHHVVYAASFSPTGEVSEPALQAPVLPELETREGHPNEPGNVRAIREYTAMIEGKPNHIVRGDLHRHTELSWDGGGGADGSILEFYRYMLDVAAMDFGAVTDHNAGSDRVSSWWYTQKSADLFHVPGAFASLFGYERSCLYPDGHRNIIHSYRGVPVVSFFTEPVPGNEGPRYAGRKLVENDTKMLYEEIRRTNGIAISHTSATRMGTDWRDNDPELEPVVEIFQGCRTSYEYEGAPRSSDADGPQVEASGYQPAGFVWNAYKRGYRLGTIASSDHGSTHISYALVYAPDLNRQAVLDAIRKRHTYGATDNIILEVRTGEHFMGDEITVSAPPRLDVKIIGTAPVSEVVVVKNEKLIYTDNPSKPSVTFSFEDPKIEPGLSYYYVRVQQEDGQMAWGSPIWVNFK